MTRSIGAAFCVVLTVASVMAAPAAADPCGMVPPVYIGEGQPITRVGLQNTYVFFKDGVETFVIRPGFEGKVDEFGMLIPFPTAPAIRKVPDHIFPHIAAAVDPPEVVVDLRFERLQRKAQSRRGASFADNKNRDGLALHRDEVRVLREEAVGMYEVAVLEAGSPAALKKWMDVHGYKYPDGMDKACEEYVKDRWCFVAVKSKVAEKEGVDPQPAQRDVDPKLPAGSTFDGHVQAMGFRFESDELVVPMRLASFNAGELRNVVYLLTDKPQKIRSIPEEYVMRQIAGDELFRNVTQPLPLRIIGGTEANIPDWQRKTLPAQRDPIPHNGAAMELFAGDLKAIQTGELTLPHEEKEKDLLAIGERLGLRGGEIDKLHADALAAESRKAVADSLAAVKKMTLTVVDGDFPREVLARKNLTFGEYKMPARRNTPESYDAKTNAAAGKKEGIIRLGAIDQSRPRFISRPGDEKNVAARIRPTATTGLLIAGLSLLTIGLLWNRRRTGVLISLAVIATVILSNRASADPCGMVPPIYTGEQNPITRIGEQQTYVFYKDGVETFVIRPGFSGKTDEFGMLIPFPTPPALRKVPDNIFPQVTAAIDPPEVVVDLRWALGKGQGGGKRYRANALAKNKQSGQGLKLLRDEVRVLKEEAVGMYEVAVLEAGSAKALNKWMDKHGYKYPKGMDEVCEEYVDDRWCFVAVKTKVGQKDGVDPKPAQRDVDSKLPDGSTFDGHVQAMGFRFETDELVVPMRLSAFNAGELRNIVYLMTDKPQKIRSIPEEYVVRQISGEDLFRNVTGPLPLRIIGGTENDIPDWQRKTLPQQRDPAPHNAAAKDLFAGDLLAVSTGELTLAHEEKEKDLLAIGERLGLRGNEIDTLHHAALEETRNKVTAGALANVKSMTLTVVDGDFPREVLARKNLAFADYRMPARRNTAQSYDAKSNGPGSPREGNVFLGAINWEKVDAKSRPRVPARPGDEKNVAARFQPSLTTTLLSGGLAIIGLAIAGMGLLRRRL